MTSCSEQLTFSFHPCKDVVADFAGGLISSDAGLLAVRELDERLGWTAAVAERLADPRDPVKVRHQRLAQVRQRLFGLIGGYEDANDHTRLRHDPILKTVAGVDLQKTLASQPTLSRFENAPTARQIAQLNRLLVEQFAQVHRRRRPKRLVLDIDPTDDPCHGGQQLALFNGFYDQHMYLPLLVFERSSGLLVGVRLRAGNVPASHRVVQLLRPIIRRLRQRWPKLDILLRADAGFATPVFYDFCEREGVGYLVGLPASNPLKHRTDWALDWLQERFRRRADPYRWIGGFRHQAASWPHPRRVLYKAEISSQGTNRRFLVTNRKGLPGHLWPEYDDRGTAETYIDDFKNGLAADRLSCHRFVANAFRLLLTAVAYNLLRAFRTMLADTELEAASIQTLRSRLLKIGARVRQTVRRVWVHLASGFAFAAALKKALQAIARLPTVASSH
jgi:hypothetical protein